MRIKKRETIMFGLLVVMSLITFSLFEMTQIPPEKPTLPVERPIELKIGTKLNTEKEKSIYDYVELLIQKYQIKGVTVLKETPGMIETDGYNRYYTEMNIIGINALQEIGVYTYCMVIQEDNLGQFYVMPYGVEMIKGDLDPLKKDIVTSTMKVVNEWGVDLTGNKVIDHTNVSPNKRDFDTLFSVQQMTKFIGEFMDAYTRALESQNFHEVDSYFKKDTPYYWKQEKAFNNLVHSTTYCSLRDIEIANVCAVNENDIFYITIYGSLYTYIGEEIFKHSLLKTYKVELDGEKLIIVGETIEP